MSEIPASHQRRWTAGQWFCFVISCGGVYLVLFAAASAYEILRTSGWPTTEGVVTELEVFEDVATATFVVTYRYTVDGKSHQGRWGEGPNHGRGIPGADSEYTALHLLINDFRDQYGQGKPITVHYDPSVPSDSYIEPEENPMIGAAIIGLFGLVLSAALPYSLKITSARAKAQAGSEKHAPPASEELAEPVADVTNKTGSTVDQRHETAAVEQLIGSTDWLPGKRVTFHRPSISRRFLLVSGLSGALLGGLACYMMSRNTTEPWEPLSALLAVVTLSTIGFLAPVTFLQGLWPRRQIVFDWKTREVVITSGEKTRSRSINSIQRLSLRSEQGYHELDVGFDDETIGLVSSLDHGFARSVNLPVDHLPRIATQLADSLKVPLEPSDSPASHLQGFWSNVPLFTKLALSAFVATVLGLVCGLVSKSIAIAILILTMISVGARIQFSTATVPYAHDESPSGATGNCWLARITLLVALAVCFAIISLLFQLTTVGAACAACVLTAFALVCFCTPDLVASQRQGVTVPMLQILEMRLRGLPVQRLVRTVAILRGRGLRCAVESAERVFRQARAAQAEILAEEVQRASNQQDVHLLPVTSAHLSSPVDGNQRGLRHHTTMLLGALAGLGIIGFFFVVTSGVQHLDNLLVQRDWIETEGTITRRMPPAGRDHSARYWFSYRVGQVNYEAECFGPRDFTEGVAKVEYDRDAPSVARLVGGWRADGMPFFAIFFAALLALCIFPLPIIIGHIVAAVWTR